MIIRPANLDTDALILVEGARDFAKRKCRDYFPTDDNKFISIAAEIMTLEGLEILLAEHENRPVGGIGVLYAPFMWNPSLTIADALFWWTVDDAPFRTGRYLIDEAMKRIDKKGAFPVLKSHEPVPHGVEKYYSNHGLLRDEAVFTRF